MIEDRLLSVSSCAVQGPHGFVPVRVYEPRVEPASLIVWLHGGGFTGGSLDWPEAHLVASEMCRTREAVVVSVDYRLATEGTRYPVPVDDTVAAWEWATRTFAVAVAQIGGASAGAALAVAAAIRASEAASRAADGLLLAYPLLHFPVPAVTDDTHRAMLERSEALKLPAAAVEAMVANYVGSLHNVPPLALPGAADLRGLPPARIVVADLDDLRPSGELFTRQLQQAGVPADLLVAPESTHGFMNVDPLGDDAHAAIAFLTAPLDTRTPSC